MSQPRPDLDNSREAVEKMLTSISVMQGAGEVRVKGSRSPKTKREPREASDWDLEILVKDRKVFFPDPRKAYKVNADLHRVLQFTPSAVSLKEAIGE